MWNEKNNAEPGIFKIYGTSEVLFISKARATWVALQIFAENSRLIPDFLQLKLHQIYAKRRQERISFGQKPFFYARDCELLS